MLEGSCECGAVHMLDLPLLRSALVVLRPEAGADPHHCTVCGCVTHWAPVDKGYPRMWVNMRMFAPEILAPLKVVLCDAASR